MLRPGFFLFVICIAVFLVVGCERESEKEISEKEVPQAVINALNHAYPNARVRKYSEEMEDGRTLYEIAFDWAGRSIEAVYDAHGRIIESAELITIEEVPVPIKEAVAARFVRCTITKAEIINEQEGQFYEIEALNTENNHVYELLFSETGEFIEKKEDEKF